MNGLYVSILLKIFYPTINIIVLTLEKHSKKLVLSDNIIRNSFLLLDIKIDGTNSEFLHKLNKDNLFIKNGVFSLLPSPVIDLLENFTIHDINGNIYNYHKNAVPINIIMYCFMNYAQSIGVKIHYIKNEKDIGKYISNNTRFLFDATGGRISKLNYIFTDEKNKYNIKEYHRKDFNIFPVNILYGKTCYSIGDSLYQANFQEGNSVFISFCFIFALIYNYDRNDVYSINKRKINRSSTNRRKLRKKGSRKVKSM